MEKERYELHVYDDVWVDLFDNGVENKDIAHVDDIQNLLNQQDARIKEMEEKVKFYDELKKMQSATFKTLQQTDKENVKLQKQLKEIKQTGSYQVMLMCQKENILLKQQLKQSQTQKAVEELEKALNNFRNRPAYFDVARQELCLSDQDKQFIDFINNQIKELRGEENE